MTTVAAPGTSPSRRARPVVAAEAAFLAVVCYVPMLLSARGRLNADTKQYLYLDPWQLMERARSLWDSSVGGGAVTHQTIGYLWPMGPFYWLGDVVGLPDWVTQRLWIGSIQLFAALGALVLFRTLMPRKHPAQLVAALGYGLSPFVLGHVTGQSALLLPFAAFGWLVWTLVRGLDERTWRWPAAFALLVTTCGSLNGTSVFFVILGAVIWVPFGVHTLGRASARDGIVLLVRTAVLTVLTQLWWLVAYSVGGHYGLPILSVTETVQATSSTTSAAEVLRGLGYWFFYGGDVHRLWLQGLATPYMTSPALLLVSFAVPVLALVLASRLRWSSRAYFAALITVGTLIATISFAEPARSPAGVAFEAASRRIDLVLSLRNTQRAGPLVALGLMGLLSASLTALWARHPRRALITATALVLGIVLSMPAEWRDGLIADRFHRDAIPTTWETAGKDLDEGSGTILELPGIDFAAYRWGNTLDPVSVGLTTRPVIARELVPQGGPVGVSILNALDRSFQEGWNEPAAIAPMARLLGASTVLARNDLEYERYRTVRPPRLWAALTDPASGLGTETDIGPPTANRAAADRPLLDETELGLDLDATPPPPIGLFEVPGGNRPTLATHAPDAPTVVDGSGEGLYNAAAAGLLAGERGPLLLGADLARSRTDPALFGTTPRWIITDSNRKQDERWYSLRENVGATEPADAGVSDDESVGGRIDLVSDMPASSQSVVHWEGADRITASSYGEASTLLPEDRPSNAFDGDPGTAWRVDVATIKGPYSIGIDLGRQVHPDHVDLVQPQGRPGTQRVTGATVVLDGTRRFPVRITPSHAFDAHGVRVPLDGKPFRTLEVDLTGFKPPFGPVGLAEVRIPGVKVTELVQPPTAMLDRIGPTLATQPVAVVLSRLRADPSEPVRADPEPGIQRRLDLPGAASLQLTGTARLRPNADDAETDRLVATTGPVVRSSQDLPGALGSRASAALDGRTGTAWSTPFVGLHQWWEADLGKPVAVSAFDLDVVADAHHSTPTRIGVSVDGGPAQQVRVPPITPGALGATRRVHLVLPRKQTGRTVRLTIEGSRARTTPDWYSDEPVALPIAIAEVHLPGVTPTRAGTRVDTGCRDDLLTVDGQPVPLRITGSATAALARDGLAVRTCTGAPLALAAGPHDLLATPGAGTGLDLDRLVLETPAWTTAATASASASAASPPVTLAGSGSGHAKGTVRSDGRPFWLVLDQSANAGWKLDVRGPGGTAAMVDGPHPIDGNAVGWLVHPAAAGVLQVHATWTPQHAVDLALLLSLLGALACVALAAVGWWRHLRRPVHGAQPAPFGPPRLAAGAAVDWRRSLPGAAATAVVAGLCISPVAALPTGLAMALFTSRPRWGRFIPPALVALAAGSVVFLQVRDQDQAGPGWAARFGFAHLVTLMAIILLGMEAIAEATRHRKARLRREARAADLERRRAERGTPSRRRGRYVLDPSD